MIIEAIRATYEGKAAERGGSSGNPTGSRLGTCTAQLQLLQYPERWPQDPWQPRQLMAMEEGDRLNDWLSEQIQGAYPGRWGLREQPFYFPVPIPETFDAGTGEVLTRDAMVARIATKLGEWVTRPWPCRRCLGNGRVPVPGSVGEQPHNGQWQRCTSCHGEGRARGRRVWGTVEPGFVRPLIYRTPEGKVRTQGRIGEPERDMGGIRLDTAPRDGGGPCLWVPVYVDGIIDHPQLGPTVVENKSMSNWQFRRALVGQLDWGKRAQIVAAVIATGMESALIIARRRETAHLGELAYSKGITRTLVRLRDLSGREDTYLVTHADPKETVAVRWQGDVHDGQPLEGAAPGPLPGDSTWDLAYGYSPWDPSVIPAMHEHVLRVLLTDGRRIHRQYGPDFRCAGCAGAGEYTCRCVKAGAPGFNKSGKPCGWCQPADPETAAKRRGSAPGKMKCEDCGGRGTVERTELPAYPCGYCPVVLTCWKGAGVQREIDQRPHHWIDRAAYELSGLAFYPLEDAVMMAERAPEPEETIV